MPSRSLMLQDAIKTYRHDQDKTTDPETTVAQFRRRLAQTGLAILEDVVRIDNGRLDIPVYFSLCGSEARTIIGNEKQMGKGATAAQAQASAVMELAERFSLFSYRRDPTRFTTATWKDLSGRQEPLMGFDTIARSVQDESDDLPLARRFFEELPLQWSWAHNLSSGQALQIPFNWFWTLNEFNGSSAGNCNEEALCQGICEVIERHVSALICSRQRMAPLIDQHSIADPVALELLAKFRRAGVDVFVSDFSCNMGIPSLGVLAWDPANFPRASEIVWTAGTAPDPARALCRALTEVAQLSGDFNTNANYVASGLPKLRRIQDARHITHPGRSLPFRNLPDLSDTNIKTEVQRCIEALTARGFETYTVDVRHDRLNIPAFYTFVPGTSFRERAVAANVAMICARIAADSLPADSALKWLSELDASLPGKYFVHFFMGQIHLTQGRYAESETHFSLAAALQAPDEDLATIFTYLGICRKEMENYSTALKALRRAETLDPDRTDTLNLIGFCYFKLKDHARAVQAFEKIIALNPSSAIDYANLAVNHRALGDREKAIHYFQLALTLNPDIDFARVHLEQMGIAVEK